MRGRGGEGDGKDQQGSQEEPIRGLVGWGSQTKIKNHGVTKVYCLLEACSKINLVYYNISLVFIVWAIWRLWYLGAKAWLSLISLHLSKTYWRREEDEGAK